MGAILKKHKIIDTFTSKPSFQRAIVSFGKISKSTTVTTDNKKRKAIELEQDELPCPEVKKSKNRKTEDAFIPPPKQEKSVEKLVKLEGTVATGERKRKHIESEVAPLAKAIQVPAKPRKKAPLRSKPNVVESPLKSARAILEAFVISVPAKTEFEQHPVSKTDVKIARKLPCDLPEKLRDLVDLHYAFLNALSLHYAHHGTSSPSDIRVLKPSIERTWGKRRITLEDIQLILGIQKHIANKDVETEIRDILSICDYGKGKLCIEFDDPTYNSTHAQPIPIDELLARFSANMHTLYALNPSISSFPLAKITPFSDTVPPSGPSKGAVRLSEIKAGAVKAQTISSTSILFTNNTVSTSAGSEPAAPTNRGASLLDRIRAKQAHAATLPAAPTLEALARRAALQRLEEIIPVLEILSSSSSSNISSRPNARSGTTKCLNLGDLSDLSSLSLNGAPAPRSVKVASFTLSMIVQHLQMSLRHPIAKEEVELAIKLLAKEVAPAWAGMREVGSVVGVTFRGTPRRAELMARLRELVKNA